MPIDNESYRDRLKDIEGNPLLQRYISLEKLVSMLHKQSLFFTRVDCLLDDPFEGTSPKIVRKGLRRWYESHRDAGHYKLPMTDEIIEQSIKDFEQGIESERALVTVNCWHNRPTENALMWKSYSTNNNGIMIVTDYNRLVNSLEIAQESIQSSEVLYADYESDENINFGSTLYAVIYKRHFFSDEKEIRLIHQVSQVNWVHDWVSEECQQGVYIKANIDELIKEIRVAPFAPDWYLEVVKSVCEKYGLRKEVLRSSLAK
jgi:hypothetical protein